MADHDKSGKETHEGGEPNHGQLAELTHLTDEGMLEVMVDRTYSLAEAREAFKSSLERGRLGKVVLKVIGEG